MPTEFHIWDAVWPLVQARQERATFDPQAQVLPWSGVWGVLAWSPTETPSGVVLVRVHHRRDAKALMRTLQVQQCCQRHHRRQTYPGRAEEIQCLKEGNTKMTTFLMKGKINLYSGEPWWSYYKPQIIRMELWEPAARFIYFLCMRK